MMDKQQKVATAKALYRALAEGDKVTISKLLHDDFSGKTTQGLPAELGEQYGSAKAMKGQFWARVGQLYEAQACPETFEILGDGDLLVEGVYRGVAKNNGYPLNAAFFHRLTFEDDQILRLQQLTDSAQWHQSLAGGASLSSNSQTRLFETLLFHVEDGLATLSLNRPENRNAIDLRMANELHQVAMCCRSDSSIRALLIRAEGSVFTVGGDLAYLNRLDPHELPDMLTRMTTLYHQALSILADLPIPVVTAAKGAIAGGGLGLMHVADIVLVADELKMALGFGKLGLSMDGGSSWYLPRLIGTRRTAELYFEGRTLNASELVEWGLANRCVPSKDLSQHAVVLARQLASGPTFAYGRARRLLRQSIETDLAEQLRDEVEALAAGGGTGDAEEGIRAFLEHRHPAFEGR